MLCVTSLNIPSLFSIDSINPSHAEPKALISPCSVSETVLAISSALPSALFKDSVNSFAAFSLSAKVKAKEALLLSNNSTASATGLVALLIFSKDCSNVNPFCSSFINIFLKAVPEVLASKPASVNLPNKAVVFSKDIPAVDATGATFAIAKPNLSKSKAEPLKALAITSVTLPASLASNPKPLIVAPAIVADCAKSELVAVAKFKVASVAFNISAVEKPNLAYSS